MIGRLSDVYAVLTPLGATRVPPARPAPVGEDPRVLGVALHSRRVAAGEVFVALPGSRHDGREFAAEAASRGAVAAVVSRPLAGLPIEQIVVGDPRAAAAEVAAAWFGHPSRRLLCVGVTGTNGKTTTTWHLRAILEAAGRRTALLGTIAYELLGRSVPAPNTTPDALALQGYLREALDAGADACVMEVSSHALDQERVRGIDYDAAVFTNLTPEHLDYHADLDAYREAKARLFDGLAGSAIAAVGVDDPSAARMSARTRAKVLRFALGAADAEVRAEVLDATLDRTRLRLHGPSGSLALELPMPGVHNARNALGAAAAAIGLGVPLAAIGEGLASVRGVPGRFERIDAGAPFRVCVDYAHTDASLEAVLAHVRPLVKGRLLVVFGCGGDRDRGKRPRMGAVAARFADRIVLTSDNPRSEDPGAIVRDILAGIDRRGVVRTVIDRREAIREAIGQARRGDLVLIAGKGHERVQVVGGESRPFDDREIAREALRGND